MKKLSFILAALFLFTSVAVTPISGSVAYAAEKDTKNKTTKKVKTKKVTKPAEAAKKKDNSKIDEAADKAKDDKVGDGIACRAGVVNLSNDYKKQISDISAQAAGDDVSRQTLINQRAEKLSAAYTASREKNKSARDKLYASLKAKANTDEKKKAVDAFIKERDRLSEDLVAKNDASLNDFKVKALASAQGAVSASQTGLVDVTNANTYGYNTAIAACNTGKKFSQVRGDYRGTVREKLTDYRSTTRSGFVQQIDDLEQERRKAVAENNKDIGGKMNAARVEVQKKLKVKKPKTVKPKAQPKPKPAPATKAPAPAPATNTTPTVTTSSPSPTVATPKPTAPKKVSASKVEENAKKRAAAAAERQKKREAAAKKEADRIERNRARAEVRRVNTRIKAASSPSIPPTKKSQCFQNSTSGGLVCANKGHNYVCQETSKIKASAGARSSNEITNCVKQN